MITLERMYFADTCRRRRSVRHVQGGEVGARDGQGAHRPLQRSWSPKKYKDTYRETLCKIIEQKRKGKKVHVETTREPEEALNLMDALRREPRRRRGPGKRRRGTARQGRNGRAPPPASKATAKR